MRSSRHSEKIQIFSFLPSGLAPPTYAEAASLEQQLLEAVLSRLQRCLKKAQALSAWADAVKHSATQSDPQQMTSVKRKAGKAAVISSAVLLGDAAAALAAVAPLLSNRSVAPLLSNRSGVDKVNSGKFVAVNSTSFLGEAVEDTEFDKLDEKLFPVFREDTDPTEFARLVKESLDKSALRTAAGRQRYLDIMEARKNVFAISMEDFLAGKLQVAPLTLDVENVPAVVDKERLLDKRKLEFWDKTSLHYEQIGMLRAPTDEMIRAGVWVSNPVIVEQPDRLKGGTKLRATVDMRVNQFIKPPHGYAPQAAALNDRLIGARLIDKDDGIQGYYQWPLDEKSQRFTGVYTPRGVRVFTVMPLGINVAPARWNELMVSQVFKGADPRSFFSFMDDFIRWTVPDPEESREAFELRHLDQLDKFLGECAAVNLKLKLGKAEHAREEIEALGFCFGNDKVKKTAFTTDLIRNYPRPESPKRLKSFLHLCQYYAQFADRFAETAAPLWSGANLKKKFPENFWSGDEGAKRLQAFEQMKADLSKEVELTPAGLLEAIRSEDRLEQNGSVSDPHAERRKWPVASHLLRLA
jgi:hypothetical protein